MWPRNLHFHWLSDYSDCCQDPTTQTNLSSNCHCSCPASFCCLPVILEVPQIYLVVYFPSLSCTPLMCYFTTWEDIVSDSSQCGSHLSSPYGIMVYGIHGQFCFRQAGEWWRGRRCRGSRSVNSRHKIHHVQRCNNVLPPPPPGNLGCAGVTSATSDNTKQRRWAKKGKNPNKCLG